MVKVILLIAGHLHGVSNVKTRLHSREVELDRLQ